ncbi:bifunctional riboflavin kinase/FAD synthetase [Altibacter sp. HG106]|uniref:bifunctional riboflavin kinase/FAD synthetase n=1 Tax=Altibacter sp. HG106 TaxID=3023937 RepID=UPI0023508526|nr:bifunctional riboflavin kinase/FAD synthetase [Altibacter sp. HG106]MDC7994781.1 bifunctional riboflavin kinase/FAD synthetase [Altibacter sp. HG106]
MASNMQEYASAQAYKNTTPSVITIGTFDGVHIGHRAILKQVVDAANANELTSLLLTFFPHPRMVLQQGTDLKLINSLPEKKELLAQTGLEQLIIHPFTQAFSRMTAEAFVQELLVNRLHAKKVIIGYDHRFGRNRTANIDDLRRFGTQFGFEVEEISAQELDEVAVSSTKIRNALEVGDITTANKYLGYPYMISGTVTKGREIGRTINFPTANLQPDASYKMIPKNGVYVVQANIDGHRVYGITSIGTNPTVGGRDRTIETYFLEFSKDLYDQPLRIEFLTHIRDEETFDTLALLKEAIAKDERFAKDYIATYE